MARVYLETSFFSACVSTRTSAKSVARRETSIEWWQTQAVRHELYVSDEVVVAADELRPLRAPIRTPPARAGRPWPVRRGGRGGLC